MIAKKFVVFVPEINIREEEYSTVVEWAYEHLLHSNVLSLSEEDVYFLQYKTKILDIINEENDSMLQMGENDWIIFNDTKERIQNRLSEYRSFLLENRIKYFVDKLSYLLQKSITLNKNIYFNF